MPGCLFLVALPIGNLSDITLRAIDTLRSVDFIVAEDTRTTRRILDRFEIRTPFFSSLYQGVEEQRTDEMLRLLEQGKNLALVSDAGTPLISDPGFPLVRAAVAAGLAVQPIPGPTAAMAALVASGLAADRFCFDGSLPRKRSHREAYFTALECEPRTIVVYESPHRLLETLRILSERLPERRVVVARELTKVHEEFLRGTAEEVRRSLDDRGEVRGECVMVIEGNSKPAPPVAVETIEELLSLLEVEGVSKSGTRKILERVAGLSRNDAYDLVRRRSA